MSPHLLETTDEMTSDTFVTIASGRLEPALGLMLETMLALRSPGADLSLVIGGAFLEAQEPVAMQADALGRVFATIDAGASTEAGKRSRVAALDEMLIKLPEPLRVPASEALRLKGWKSAGPGIRSLPLKLEGSSSAELIRIEPGRTVPTHTHRGQEFTLCLVGGFSDLRGSYGPGDLAIADESVEHSPVADADGPCLVLAVTDAQLQFKGLLGLAQRLFGG